MVSGLSSSAVLCSVVASSASASAGVFGLGYFVWYPVFCTSRCEGEQKFGVPVCSTYGVYHSSLRVFPCQAAFGWYSLCSGFVVVVVGDRFWWLVRGLRFGVLLQGREEVTYVVLPFSCKYSRFCSLPAHANLTNSSSPRQSKPSQPDHCFSFCFRLLSCKSKRNFAVTVKLLLLTVTIIVRLTYHTCRYVPPLSDAVLQNGEGPSHSFKVGNFQEPQTSL